MCPFLIGEASLEPPIPEAASALELLAAAAAAAATTTTEWRAPMEVDDGEDVGEFEVAP